MSDRWFLSDCEGQLVIVREDKLRHVTRNEHGEITGYSLPAEWGPDVVIAEWDLNTWDAGDDESDDLRRAIAARIVADHNEVEQLRAERSEIRAALIRELRESHRRRLAWKSARRGRAKARAQLDDLRAQNAKTESNFEEFAEVIIPERDQARAELAEAQRVAATVRASRDEIREKLRQADAERDRLAEHAQRVRSMHAPVCGGACGLDDACECEERDLVCGECWNGESGEAHPCRTVRALDGETGGRS